MKKTLLLLGILLFFGDTSLLKAQCYGVVNFDQAVAPAPTSSNSISYTITTIYCNELIMIGYDGFNFSGDTGQGPITVDGNAATWIKTAYTTQTPTSFWVAAETWAYLAPAAGVHTILCNETGYSGTSGYDINFAADFYATGSTNPLTIASLISSETTVTCASSGPITGNITTTLPNSMIYSNVLYNDVSSASDPITFTGATFLDDLHAGDGIEGAQAYTSATSAGAYTVTATNTSNVSSCTGLQMVLVGIPPPLCSGSSLVVATANINPNCGSSNGSISLTVGGGTAPYTYIWSPAISTTASATGLSAGTYSIMINDGACPPQDTTLVVILTSGGTQITANVTANEKCNGDCVGSATVAVTGGLIPYTYSWMPAGGITSTATGLCAGTYTNTVTDNSGCAGTVSVTITEPPLLTATDVATNALCNGGTGSITVTATGGTTPYTYVWMPSGQNGITATGLSAGVYVVTVTDNNGCTVTTPGTITQPTGITVSITGTQTLCPNGTGTLTANVSGGTSPYTYAWSAGGVSSTLSITIASTQTYTVNITDATGCTSSATFTVTLGEPPTISVTASKTSICEGATVTLQAFSTNITSPYTWQPGSMTGPSISVTPTITTTYTVSASSGCGTATVTVTINVNDIPASAFTADVTSGCSPLCVQFRDRSTTGTGAITQWGWSFGNKDTLNTKNPIYCYSNSGIYSVSLTTTTDSGCSGSLNISSMITVYSNPFANFTATPQPTTILEPAIRFTNATTDAYGILYWAWNFGEPGDTLNNLENPSHTYQDTGTFCPTLVAVNQHGCADTVTNCLVIDPVFTCYIPDGFSPNGDGVNDIFEVKGNEVKSFEMYIFDRWGLQLFHSTDINEGWEGKLNNAGALCQQDAYVYLINVSDNKNQKHTFMGTVNLIK